METRSVPVGSPPDVAEPARSDDSETTGTSRPRVGTSRPRVFDKQRVLSLCNGDPDLAREMADLFLDITGTLVGELRGAVEAADADAVQRVAHTLKGAASNLAGDSLADTARQLMGLGEQRDLAAAPKILAQLDDDLAQLTKALTEFSSELAGQAA